MVEDWSKLFICWLTCLTSSSLGWDIQSQKNLMFPCLLQLIMSLAIVSCNMIPIIIYLCYNTVSLYNMCKQANGFGGNWNGNGNGKKKSNWKWSSHRTGITETNYCIHTTVHIRFITSITIVVLMSNIIFYALKKKEELTEFKKERPNWSGNSLQVCRGQSCSSFLTNFQISERIS